MLPVGVPRTRSGQLTSRSAQRFLWSAAVVVIAVCSAAAMGVPGLQAAPAHAAALAIAAAAAVLSQVENGRIARNAGRALAGAVAAASLLALAGWGAGPIRSLGSTVQLPLVLLLLGGSFLVRWRGRELVIADVIGASATCVAWLAFAGYLVNFTPYYGQYQGAVLAPSSILLSLVVCVMSFISRADRGLVAWVGSPGPAGMALRRLLPVPFVAPFVFSVINVAAQQRGLFTPLFGIWIYAVENTAIFVYTIWGTSVMIGRIHQERDRLQSEIEKANHELEARVRQRTEDLQLATELAQFNEARFRRLYDSNLVGIAFWTADGFITEANDAYLAIIGYTRQELDRLGQIPRNELTPADWLPGDEAAMQRVLATGTSGVYEKEYIRRDGTRVPVILGVAQLGADPVHGVAFVVDNTERKRAEQALHETNRKLARANEDLSQFAFAASHDLQEPLRQVTSYVQLLLRSLPGGAETEFGLFQNFIVQGTLRMQNLLDDLLAYTETGAKLDVPDEIVDTRRALAEALENIRQAIDASGAQVEVGGLPAVKGHDMHFVQLFQNLVGNAIKYRKPDEAPVIRISARRAAAEWVFSIEDNGIGISPEYHTKVFGVFKRLHGKSIPGTGIGLAICQKVVERYGGRIWVESEEGKGAAFRFTLPVVEAVR